MTGEKDTTRSLSKMLEKLTTEDEVDAFMTKIDPKDWTDFHKYLNGMICRRDIAISDIIEKSGVSKNYIYNILNGERKNPSRDKVIALCIGCELSFSETNRALELLKLSPLYPKDERDVMIAMAINKGNYNVTKVNLMLEDRDISPLEV